ncbi:MAG: hypothetical protein IKE69_08275 [Thermoguttaceae bacterium]|nr:hypothetical protein [Thermoguttaceae bacterium]
MKRYTPEELAEVLSKASEQPVDSADIRRVCADGALGTDGKITLTEFVAYLAAHVVS